jgi:GNAT superfamily N-acetyltransferase
VTPEQAEAALQVWATVQRDELIRAAHQAGVAKNRIHALTGIARTTIDRILAAPARTPQQRITPYLDGFTTAGQWPRHGRAWHGQQVMADAYDAATVADTLLADPAFRALGLGTWLTTPARVVIAAAVSALRPPLFDQDAALLTEAVQLAAQRQHNEARQKLALGLLGGAALAIALGSSRS